MTTILSAIMSSLIVSKLGIMDFSSACFLWAIVLVIDLLFWWANN